MRGEGDTNNHTDSYWSTGCRLTSTKAVQELDKWRQLWHVNLVALVKMFTTKAFGDHCKC